jgi:hypothetical protein
MREQSDSNTQPPGMRFLCRITARVAPVLVLGDVPCGVRRLVPIVGGEVEGHAFNGTVLGGGADWQLQRPDSTLDISAHYIVRLDDGDLVEIESNGYRHGAAHVMARLARNEPVEPHEYYFRTAMRFQTASSTWRHLNSYLAIGKAVRRPDAAVLDVYLVD